MDINSFFMTGNVGGEPKQRNTNGNTAVVTFRVATNYRRRDQDGTWRDDADWHTITVFGSLAELVLARVTSGTAVTIQGRIHPSRYVGSDGNDRYTVELIAENVRWVNRSGSSE